MKSLKWKIGIPVILISLLVVAKIIMWDIPISTGKRVGNMTKISKKGKVYKTWEGTLDEGSGDKLTSYFSVRNEELGQELYDYEGREVVIKYEEYIVGWPWDTKYNVISWAPKKEEGQKAASSMSTMGSDNELVEYVGKTMFCATLGSLYKNQELYNKVKDYLKEDNLYLYNQYEKCND